ncbi:MAG: transglutaminase-like domain-containing protein [Planctomycetota bacterium]|jgi:hypothetical protein
MRRILIPLLLGALPALAERTIPDAHVEEALEAAGENRAELQRVLDHYAKDADPRKLMAARFLVANMPGHGFILTRLVNGKGEPVPYDPLAYATFKDAQAALDALEKEHGELEFKRDKKIEDVKTMSADFLIRHIDNAFVVWERCPDTVRVSFDAFLNFVLPYRGSQEPVEDWLTPLMQRYAHAWRRLERLGEKKKVAGWVSKDLRRGVRFNERFYLHPTDQSFSEMLKTGQGRCEDLTNLSTYAKRSIGIATAADYTPWWAHRDNNHAWDMVLDADGKGFTKAYAHAAKVYRKTFAIQRQNLCFRLPEGREAPNRFLSNPFYIDVTEQYMPTTQVEVKVQGAEEFAYLCVFNGGVWKAIQWARVKDASATFDRMGRNIVYLPMFHDGKELRPAASPLLVHDDGSVVTLAGSGKPATVTAVSVHPKKVSPDTGAVTPVSFLEAGQAYVLKRWDDGWKDVNRVTAGDQPITFDGLVTDGLYWLVPVDDSPRRLERVFTIENGRQRWW